MRLIDPGKIASWPPYDWGEYIYVYTYGLQFEWVDMEEGDSEA